MTRFLATMVRILRIANMGGRDTHKNRITIEVHASWLAIACYSVVSGHDYNYYYQFATFVFVGSGLLLVSLVMLATSHHLTN